MQEIRLNQAQKEAVEYNNGPLIIVAGAGTGKTSVITEKISHIIKNKLAQPEEILALTFTDKAAEEMVNRVDRSIDIGYSELQISTFHSFCQRLLENYGLDIGINTKFNVLSETEAWLLVRRHLDYFNLDYYRSMGNPSGHIHELISHFSKCKDELISPAEYLEYAENVKMDNDDMNREERSRLSEIAGAYHAYNRLLLDNNSLDFSDLIYYAIKLIKERKVIAGALRTRYKFILVDEFQDVNWSQYQLVRLLCGEECKLTVVGDDDQSIYAFRGASVSNILRFKDDYPRAKEIVLNENYRSGQDILDSSYKLIKNNDPDRLEAKLKINKKLVSADNAGAGKVEFISCSSLHDEVKSVISKIEELKNSDDTLVYDDFAILIRANSQAEPFMSALEKAGVPYEYLAASGLYRQPLVLDCINYLKLVDNYHESTAVFRLLYLPPWNTDEHDIQKIAYAAKKKAVSYYEVMKNCRQFGVSENGIKICDSIVSVIHTGMSLAKTEKPTDVLYNFLNESGYLAYLTREEEQGNRAVIRQIYQLKEFFEYVGKYENETPGATVAGFMDHFNFILESGDEGSLFQPVETPDSVNILTVHKAKGLEFKFVFLVDLVEDRFPARRRSDKIEIPVALIKEKLPEGDIHIQEERRLFYVAMTRAKNSLFLYGAADYGGVRMKKMSRFLAELGYKDNAVRAEESDKISSDLAPVSGSETPAKENFVYQIPDSFSFSQIKSYNACPYQYKLAHIIKIPTRSSASFSFGTTMHSTLQKFYQRVQELNKAEQFSLFAAVAAPKNGQTAVPDLKELLDFYDESWIGDWYKNKKQKDEYYETGKDILKTFYETQKDHWTVPVALERSFKIRVGDYLLKGRIDRVDQLPDGTLEILDYKTGQPKEKVEGEDKDQLVIYQIAVSQLPDFKNIGAPGRLTYYYLTDNSTVEFLGSEKDVAKISEKLSAAIEKICRGDFAATPGSHVCKSCEFHDICQYRAL
jgi:DNA helicase-2/ATP-dependent DNA helicase PcrA